MSAIVTNSDSNYFIQIAQFTDIKDIARVHVNSWCETYEGIVAKTYLESLKYTDRERMWEMLIPRKKGHGGTLVIKDPNGEVVGFCDFGPAREHEHGIDSEVYAIYLLKKVQGKGLGKLLLYKAFELLKDQGFRSVYLWILKDNPTKYFYEKLGGEYLKYTTVNIGEQQLAEELYCWDL